MIMVNRGVRETPWRAGCSACLLSRFLDLEQTHLLRIARRPAQFALPLQLRQRLFRIKNDPTPLIQLMLEQWQQGWLGIGVLVHRERRAVEFEILGEQRLILEHWIEKRRIAHEFG